MTGRSSEARPEAVLLLHGLWMNRYVMSPLQAALEAQGFAAHTVGYRSMRGDLQEHLARIDQSMAELGEARIHLVGHSMGGVIALAWRMREAAKPGRQAGRTVLLGSPVSNCEAASNFGSHAAGRLLMGNSVAIWEEAMPLAVPRVEQTGEGGCEVGAIAGTERFGLGPLFVTLDGENDGVVRVEETWLSGLADHLTLPVSHTGMLIDAEVARQCAAFLRQGRFER